MIPFFESFCLIFKRGFYFSVIFSCFFGIYFESLLLVIERPTHFLLTFFLYVILIDAMKQL